MINKQEAHVKELMAKFAKDRKARLAKRKAEGKCCAQLHHGPGHQSSTYCYKVGEHKIHECIYGSFESYATWKGMKKFTGCFDESP